MTSKKISLKIMDGEFAIHRLLPDKSVPKKVLDSPVFSITRTPEELSIIAPSSVEVKSDRQESGWACLQVAGPLKFSEIGIIAGIANELSLAEISLLSFSTFDTDYILVKMDRLKEARNALMNAGYKVSRKTTPASIQEEKPSSWIESTNAVLEKHVPIIRKLLTEKIGPVVLSTMRSDAALSVALGSIYEFLPLAVRVIVRREIFIEFGLKNRDRLFFISDRDKVTIKSARKKK